MLGRALRGQLHKRVYRLYKLEGLSLRLKTPKKRLSRQRVEGAAGHTAGRVLEHGLHLRLAVQIRDALERVTQTK